MHKIVDYEDKQLRMVSNALLPRLFRYHFGKDLVMTMKAFEKSYKEDPETVDFAPVENLTWLMLKEGGEDVGGSPEEWLASLDDPSASYVLAAEAMTLWRESQKTTSVPKKK